MRLFLAAMCTAAGPVMAGTPDPIAGEEAFIDLCAGCHGVEATGDGPMAEILRVQPPDLTRLSLQNDGVFPVFQIVRQIDGRDPLLAHGGEMPIFGMIFDFQDTALATEAGQPILTSQLIADVVVWLEERQE